LHALSCFGLAYTISSLLGFICMEVEPPAKQCGIKKNEVLLGTSYKTHWERGEHIGNLMGTHWQ